MNWLRRIGTSALLLSLLFALTVGHAVAADISTVADDVSASGFYLDRGVSISDGDATEIVTAARNNGSRFHLVVLDDTPLGGNTAFAEAILDELNIPSGTILVLSPEDVGWVSEDEGFAETDMEEAFEFANAAGGNDAQYAANFVVGLVGEPGVPATTAASGSEGVPATVGGQSAAAAEPSGGGSGFLWFIVIVGGIGLLVFFLIRRGGRQTVNAGAEQMAKARMAVQKQVDAVANDILDMEDEVRVADNAEADRFYNEASATYRDVTERLLKAETPQHLLDISNDLDIAIWQLDSAEAILDGKPKPPRPEPKRLEPERRPTGGRVTVPSPRPDYQRRPSRRSSYLGPGMLEMLIGVAGQVLAGGSRRPRGGGLGSLLRRSSSPSGSRADGPTSRSGGGVVPGPGSPVQRRSSSRSPRATRSSRPSRRRSGGGRIRGGGRRRK
jgi:hypothetical protein